MQCFGHLNNDRVCDLCKKQDLQYYTDCKDKTFSEFERIMALPGKEKLKRAFKNFTRGYW